MKRIDGCKYRPTPTPKGFEKDLSLPADDNETRPTITTAPLQLHIKLLSEFHVLPLIYVFVTLITPFSEGKSEYNIYTILNLGLPYFNILLNVIK